MSRWRTPYAGAGLLAAWLIVAFWLFPILLEMAYRGQGVPFLASALDGRDVHPVEYYLARWRLVADEGLVLLIAGGVGAIVWSARRLQLNDHWFAPARLDHLAIARIGLVGLQLLLLIWPAIPGCSGCSVAEHSLLARADPIHYQPVFIQQILLAPFGWGMRPDAEMMGLIRTAALVCGVLALLGIVGRLALVGFAWSSTLLVANTYSYAGEYHHSEGLLLIGLWVLAASPCFRWNRLSAGRLFRRQQGPASVSTSPYARWPFRLMQWMLALTYFDAGVAKLLHPDFAWFQPTTLAFYLARDGLMSGFSMGVWLSEHAWLLPALAVATVALELAFFLGVLIPRLAPSMVLAMTALHIGIYVTQSAAFPQHVALLWFAFLPELSERWRGRRTRAAPASSAPAYTAA